MKRVLLCVALLACAGIASANVVYKWVDAQGKTLYGDRPPDGVKAEVVSLLGRRADRPVAHALRPVRVCRVLRNPDRARGRSRSRTRKKKWMRTWPRAATSNAPRRATVTRNTSPIAGSIKKARTASVNICPTKKSMRSASTRNATPTASAAAAPSVAANCAR
jgi:Domain of unknown function (DUF4124)